MSDIWTLLQNAIIKDTSGVRVGEVFALHISCGKMTIIADLTDLHVHEDDDYDPDDGEKEDIPEDSVPTTTNAEGKTINEKIAELRVVNE